MEPLRTDYKVDMEENTTSYNGHFPEDLPPRSQAAGPSFGQRLKSFLTFSPKSYSLIHTEDGAARLRHMAMISIILIRLAQSGLSVFWALVRKNVAETIIYIILAILTTWFTATCLAIIGDAKGERKLWGMTIKRWHLDAFLYLEVIAHMVLLFLFFFGLSGRAMDIIGIGLWLAILGVAFIAGWKPNVSAFQRVWVT